ncbi:MAG: oligo-1,6-glucosidase [Actinomycetales bacterium]|nr:oligo-1,6-glucosidase [Actinomycetales bacterium]
MSTDWLRDAVIYEIYPQSFADSNGDGIGDLRGVIDHLDHLSWLGVNTIWFNPCFASPFRDAGYDVSDYLQIAPRYGTNDDMVELVDAAAERGIRVLLDLVAGHTSIAHEWFRGELAADGPSPEGDRYVWSLNPPLRDTSGDIPGTAAWVPSPGPRPGWYLKNFFDEQPALNFGWARLEPGEPWRDAVDAPGPMRNRQALRDIMAFWLDHGVAGFRVDMAFSLVKDDPGHGETTRLWRDLRAWLAEAYPDAVLIPEGIEPRGQGTPAFDADFLLVIFEQHASLFDNGGAGQVPFHEPLEPFFQAEGGGSFHPFLDAWEGLTSEAPSRPLILASADHDLNRLAHGPRTAAELRPAFAFLLTWGTVPSIYYGDEIGMRYLPGLPDVEGSICNPAYNRSGCRTPMQWDGTANAGFSTAAASELYLPIDPDPARPTVLAQRDDPGSLLHLVRDLIALRKDEPALGARDGTRVLHADYPLAYLRGDDHLVLINPTTDVRTVELPRLDGARLLLGEGVGVNGGAVTTAACGFGIWRLQP